MRIKLVFPVVSCLVVAFLASLAQAQIPIVRVTASSHEEPNVPTNTLSLDRTRWSARGAGQWIQYELPGAPWYISSALLDWHGATRVTTFDVDVSPDGETWHRIFSGGSIQEPGPRAYSFLEGGVSPTPRARFIRITGYGNTKNDWNSLRFAQFFGGNDENSPPTHYVSEIAVQGGSDPDDYSKYDVIDYDIGSSFFLPAGTWIDITLTPFNTITLPFDPEEVPTTRTRCIGVYWDNDSVPFRVEVIRDDDIPRTIVQAVSTTRSLRVYPVDPAVDQGNPYFNRFRITPEADASLVEIVFLYDCNDQGDQQYPSSVMASSYQSPNFPGNTLDGNVKTRWSAEGGQTIEYELRENTYEAVGIHWYQGHKRTAFFEVEMSLNGFDWYPVLLDGQSRRTNDLEWYTFPPTYGRYIRITGDGNSVNAWNSILEVIFGSPEGMTLALQ